MAVVHSVWIRFRPDINAATAQQHMDALASLTNIVDCITRLTLGENFTDRADGFTHAMTVELPSKADLTKYATHPQHVEIATALKRDADVMAMDYEC